LVTGFEEARSEVRRAKVIGPKGREREGRGGKGFGREDSELLSASYGVWGAL